MESNCTPCGEYRCQLPIILNGQPVGIDKCIFDIICALNAEGLETVASCCGHGKRAGSIILKDGRELVIFPKDVAREAKKTFPPCSLEKKRSKNATDQD
jgi:hypothetical protein